MTAVTYPVVERFHSVQGEGFFLGRGATFIRLAGCNLRCAWCDTPESFDSGRATVLTAQEIVGDGQEFQPLVVITGGEPTLHDLGSLVAELHRAGKFVAIETNGTQSIPAEWGIDWVTASPKPDSGYALKCQADELKYVVDDIFTVDCVQMAAVPAGRIFLQVESGRAESAQKAYQIVMDNPDKKLRLGIQLHKVLGVS